MHRHNHHQPKDFSRRGFIKSTGALALFTLGFGGVPGFIAQAAANHRLSGLYAKKKILICIFQRGAMDGLACVTPFEDVYLKKARPGILMSAAKTNGVESLIDLDGRFGLHPSMAAFEPFFREGRLAIVHGVGSPNNSRSHFDAQDYMESATPFSKNTPNGWLNRASGLMGHDAVTPFRAVSITSSLPRSMSGENPALAIQNLQDFALQLKGNPAGINQTAKSFEDLYDHTANNLLNKAGSASFDAMKMLQSAGSEKYKPQNGAVYPTSALGRSLQQIASLIKMDVGLEIGFAECGGWDTHLNQGKEIGTFSRLTGDLAKSIHAFWTDLGAMQDEVELITMTEFGRTVKQNGTAGTDHGRGSCMFVLGNAVNGGKVHGKVPELADENLEDRRDLPVTTDFRSVFQDLASNHLGLKNPAELFPGFKNETPIKLHKG